MPAPSPRGDLLLQRTLSPRGPSPPEDPLSPDGDSPCLAAQFTLYPRAPSFACRRFTLSRLTAIHLVPQGTLSSRGPSPPEDPLLLRNSPCLACRRFTLSCSAIHLVPQGTLSSRGPSLASRRFTLYPRATLSRLTAIHLVLLRNSPCTPGHPLSPDGDSPCPGGRGN